MEPAPKPLNVLVYMQGTHYIAQCLEYDIGAQARGLDDVMKSFARIFAAQIISDVRSNRAPLQDVPPAPARFFEMFRRAKPVAERTPLPIATAVDASDVPVIPPPWMVAELGEMRVL